MSLAFLFMTKKISIDSLQLNSVKIIFRIFFLCRKYLLGRMIRKFLMI